jgi:5-oxoprolinase (ATP-hydrolysing) subunit C
MPDNNIYIISPGFQTTIQDIPGRVSCRGYGVSTSGPLDDFSFRIANFLVGNQMGTASIEIQFSGPEIEFRDGRRIAICGADNSPRKNELPLELWRAHELRKGDRLSFGFPLTGARTYLAISGGIDVPSVIGSRATDMRLGIGGINGLPFRAGASIRLGQANLSDKMLLKLKREYRPIYTKTWDVAVVRGPYDEFLSDADIQLFLTAPWRVTARSDRLGYRLEGPSFEFSRLAHKGAEENGGEPTSIISYATPVGAINICGQTPIILLHDSFTVTGYICPFTVTTEEIRKVGQARPGDLIYFHEVAPDVSLRDAYFFAHLTEFSELVE